MSKQEYTEKTYSFYQLLSDYKIEIPIIQRDYAQGRDDKSEIRNSFLSALLESMQLGRPRLKLDFIYGSIVNGCFQPLDGQQRLTTLFLLHWFAALKENTINLETKELLSRFTYETRISSRDFCSALINNSIEYNDFSMCKMSASIINSPWFFLSWKKDPTISAMLRTIDDIYDKFSGIEGLWDMLCSEHSPIYFYFVQLENIGLTDDLYIKMNARGKLLSPFENFKASLQKLVQDRKWERSMGHKDRFSFRIDTQWVDLFWDNFKIGNNVDDPLMRFMSTIIMIKLASEKVIEDRVGWIKKLHDDYNNLRVILITQDSYGYLYKCFELYNQRLEELKSVVLDFPLWRHSPSGNFLSHIANPSHTASYSHKVLFFAQTEYLLKNLTFNVDKYKDWMRVVRNIVARGNVEASGKRADITRSPEAFDSAITLVAELAKGCDDIYLYLAKVGDISSSFAKNQIEEEKFKAKLMYVDKEYRELIWRLEDTDLLMGRIDFAFYCMSGYQAGNIASVDQSKLSAIAEVIGKYFSKDGDISPNLRRALLTIEYNGEYKYYNYWRSFWSVGAATKHCLINGFRELEYCIAHDSCREYLKKLVNQLSTQTLENLIASFVPPADMPNWQIKLIKEPEHLNVKFSNFIAIPDDDSCCYLLRSKRPRELEGNTRS